MVANIADPVIEVSSAGSLNVMFQDWLVESGMSGTVVLWITIAAGLFVTVVLALLANFITKFVILRIVHHFIKRSRTTWDDVLIEKKVFSKLSHLAPAIVIYAMAPLVFEAYPTASEAMRLVSQIYIVMVALLVIDSFLNAVVEICRRYEFSRKIPIRGFIQVVKIVLYFLGGIFILSLIVSEGPAKILAGMGAMTAILMLVFKDSILGFVAGIQLSVNKMVHVGDWIEMPKYGADGDVIDITLTTVKVQNWDKTISTIPAYALIADSFKNWRGMSESGGRRIKRSIYIDMNSIRFCDEKMLDKFKKFQHIVDYIETMKKEVAEFNAANDVDESELINGRRLTNVGTFRAYIAAYLKNHPKVNQDMTFLIRHLEPTPQGLPIQIYVFCKDQRWANYEAIQADIFDHILAVVGEFGLRVFQHPSGADFNSEFIVRQK